MYTRLLEPDQISHTQSMVAKRGHTNQANVHTPTCVWKRRLKHSTAEFQSIQQFLLLQKKKKKKTKNADAQVWGDARGDQKLETFLGGLPRSSWSPSRPVRPGRRSQ